jgi:hypothetical protein
MKLCILNLYFTRALSLHTFIFLCKYYETELSDDQVQLRQNLWLSMICRFEPMRLLLIV